MHLLDAQDRALTTSGVVDSAKTTLIFTKTQSSRHLHPL